MAITYRALYNLVDGEFHVPDRINGHKITYKIEITAKIVEDGAKCAISGGRYVTEGFRMADIYVKIKVEAGGRNTEKQYMFRHVHLRKQGIQPTMEKGQKIEPLVVTCPVEDLVNDLYQALSTIRVQPEGTIKLLNEIVDYAKSLAERLEADMRSSGYSEGAVGPGYGLVP